MMLSLTWRCITIDKMNNLRVGERLSVRECLCKERDNLDSRKEVLITILSKLSSSPLERDLMNIGLKFLRMIVLLRPMFFASFLFRVWDFAARELIAIVVDSCAC